MRVISGFLRGRIIKGDKIEGTRPTMDSIKESLFAIIQNDVKNAICLDLFAGSGSLGIEAISNGASYTYFVDKNRIAINTINDNIKTFKIDDYTKVILDDYMKALQSFKRQNLKFNLIFLDPPYKNHFIDGILKFVSENNLLYENGQVICELNDEILQEQYNKLEVRKEKMF
jgi:16S rRNA (guanine966-N2)-methyltransferase